VEESAVVAGLFTMGLEVRASNRGARRFYAALGYGETARLPDYYNGTEDAIRLVRDLKVTSSRLGQSQ
ncbi:MAG: GNAT family N-acetyltransferase, partial [Steroidobacteraceae bacterium]